MNYELLAIIFTIVGTGAVMTGLIMPRLSRIDEHIVELRERMSNLEGSMGVLKDLFQASLSVKMQ